MKVDLLQKAVGDVNEEIPLPVPVARRLSELVTPPDDDPNELLKYRFLGRGGGLLFVGPTGVGKSTCAMQGMMQWALGRDLFGIQATRPLKSLLVQAENDDGDMAEMRDGIIRGLGLSEEQQAIVGKSILVVREDIRTNFAFVNGVLQPLLEQHAPDLLWIDPALSYLGGDASSQKDVGGFLRNMLNPLLRKYGCGCVILHHTNKPPTGRDKPDWQAGDFAYMGTGSIEWPGWARGTIVLRNIGSQTVFELRASKRGRRLRWKASDGETPLFYKLIAQSKQDEVIYWRDAEPDEIPESQQAKKVATKGDLLPHVPVLGSITKEALRSKANRAGIAVNKINGLIAELIQDGILYEWLVPRPRTNPQKQISRFPQSPAELIK